MSGKYSGAIVFVSLVAISLAAIHSEPFEPSESHRGPTSVLAKKHALEDVKASFLKHTHKLRGPVETIIELVGTKPENQGDVFALRGLVSSAEELSEVDFKWSIPEGLEVVSGQVQGRISLVSAGRPAEVQITLRQLSSENHQVHFLAGATHDGARVADSAQHNTQIQELINESKKELLESTKRQAEKDSKRLKVFH